MSSDSTIFGFPTRPQPKVPNPAAGGPVSGQAMLDELLGAMAANQRAQPQQQTERHNLQSGALFGRHLGTGGAEVTPSNPTGNASNPWDPHGLFAGGFKANMDPAAIKESQGATAQNQWEQPGHFPGSAPSGVSAPDAALAAGGGNQTAPSPFHMPTPLAGPGSTDAANAANIQQNLNLYQPGGFKAPAAFPMVPPAVTPPPPRPTPPAALGSPRPGFSF